MGDTVRVRTAPLARRRGPLSWRLALSLLVVPAFPVLLPIAPTRAEGAAAPEGGNEAARAETAMAEGEKALAARRFSVAREALKRAHEGFMKLGNRSRSIESLTLLASLETDVGRYNLAANYLAMARALMESGPSEASGDSDAPPPPPVPSAKTSSVSEAPTAPRVPPRAAAASPPDAGPTATPPPPAEAEGLAPAPTAAPAATAPVSAEGALPAKAIDAPPVVKAPAPAVTAIAAAPAATAADVPTRPTRPAPPRVAPAPSTEVEEPPFPSDTVPALVAPVPPPPERPARRLTALIVWMNNTDGRLLAAGGLIGIALLSGLMLAWTRRR